MNKEQMASKYQDLIDRISFDEAVNNLAQIASGFTGTLEQNMALQASLHRVRCVSTLAADLTNAQARHREQLERVLAVRASIYGGDSGFLQIQADQALDWACGALKDLSEGIIKLRAERDILWEDFVKVTKERDEARENAGIVRAQRDEARRDLERMREAIADDQARRDREASLPGHGAG